MIHRSPRRAPARSLRRAVMAGLLALCGATDAHAQDGILPRSLTPEFRYLSRLAGNLSIPVEGVSASALRSSYREGRSGGRLHRAIDIHAPRGTPVLAAADGTVLRLYRRGKGGNSIYHLDPDGKTRYYYAHLDAYAPGLAEGQTIRRGQVLGYVGDTGNARPGDYHLHFSIAILSDLSRWWEGENVDPYPLLVGR